MISAQFRKSKRKRKCVTVWTKLEEIIWTDLIYFYILSAATGIKNLYIDVT